MLVEVHFFFSAKKKRTKEKTRGCTLSYNGSAGARPVVTAQAEATWFGYLRFSALQNEFLSTSLRATEEPKKEYSLLVSKQLRPKAGKTMVGLRMAKALYLLQKGRTAGSDSWAKDTSLWFYLLVRYGLCEKKPLADCAFWLLCGEDKVTKPPRL